MIGDELRGRLEQVAAENGFEPVIELLVADARECAYVVNDEDPVRATQRGASRIGGPPDLPHSLAWPDAIPRDEDPATSGFIAQINLSDVPPIRDLPLPRSGHLWFFLTSWPERGPEVGIAVYHASAAAAELRPVDDDANSLLGDVLTPTALRFERGISLPFGRLRFRETIIDLLPNGPWWEDISAAIRPEDAVGQIGGYASTYDGDDMATTLALHRLGRSDVPHSHRYRSIAEMEQAIARVPKYIRTDEERAAWIKSFEPVRKDVEWLERHREQIENWRLLLRLDPNGAANLTPADSWPIWTFARLDELRLDRFQNILATISP